MNVFPLEIVALLASKFVHVQMFSAVTLYHTTFCRHDCLLLSFCVHHEYASHKNGGYHTKFIQYKIGLFQLLASNVNDCESYSFNFRLFFFLLSNEENYKQRQTRVQVLVAFLNKALKIKPL